MRKALASPPSAASRVISLTPPSGAPVAKALRRISSESTSYATGRVAVSTAGRIDMVEMTDILYIKAESNYVRIFALGQTTYLMAKTLKQVSAGLIQYGFIRIHQSFLVHPAMIRSYRTKESVVILRSGDELPVSRSNRKLVSQQLMKWS